jgi:hypothetical protein
LVPLDLSSAFDTVDDETLLNVLTRRFGVNCSVPQGSVLGPQEFIALQSAAGRAHCHSFHPGQHLYAEETQLVKKTRIADVGSNILTLQQCIEATHQWSASRRLQLNPCKTEVIWFGTKASLKKMVTMNLALHAGNDVIDSVSSVRHLGVLSDREFSMKTHISM